MQNLKLMLNGLRLSVQIYTELNRIRHMSKKGRRKYGR